MTAISAPELVDKYIKVDGLNLRYLEAGTGAPLLLLHGASLGSSADVFRRNIAALSDKGFRAIAFDYPGFGLTELPSDFSVPYRRGFIAKFIDALGLEKVGLIAHSQSGGLAIQVALAEPHRYSGVFILGTGSLLPPLPESATDISEVPARRDPSKPPTEPTIDTTRRLLESQLYHHDLITDAELQLRFERSIGNPFKAHVERWKLSNKPSGTKSSASNGPARPLWERLGELAMPLLMIYGREDRAEAAARATYFKQISPSIDVRIVDHCKHLVPWDAADQVAELSVELFKD